MGKGFNNRSHRKSDVIRAFRAYNIILVDSGQRKLNIQSLPPDVKPSRPLVLHYDHREQVQAYEIVHFSKAVNVDPKKLDLG